MMSPNIYLNASAHHASFIAPVPVFSVYPPLRPQIIKNVGRKLRRNFYPRHNSDTRHQEAGQVDYDGSGQQSCKCNYVDFSKWALPME